MDAQARGKSAAARSSWTAVLLAPGVCLVRPRRAAAWIAAASRSAFLLVALLGLLVYAGLLIFLMLWEETFDRGSFTNAWTAWHATAVDGWFGPAELTLTLVLLLGPLLVLVLAWLSLPVVHRSGSVWRAYARAVRATGLIVLPITVATAACGTIFVILEHQDSLGLRRMTRGLYLEPGLGLFVCIGVSLWLLLWWLQGAVAGAAVDEGPPALPPLCEGCGYDLTHQPAEGRCPECGRAIAASLVAEGSRPGSPWARRKTTAAWLATSYEVLVRPRAFYRCLRLRTPPVAERGFATRHYVRLGLGGALWGSLMVAFVPEGGGTMSAGELLELALVLCGLVAWGVLGCWIGHRTIGALVTSWWLARRALPDTAWVAKVMLYETAFLWVFCGFWGVLIGSYVVVGPWLSLLAGATGRPFFVWNIPIEVWAIMGGTLALAGLWLWRYSVAYQSVRWSNF
jgi:hypothetical protein